MVVVLIAMVVTGLTWWLAEPTPAPEKSSVGPRHTPDFAVERFSDTSMDREGNPKQTLKAIEMAHYPDDDSTELTEPRLTIHEGDLPPWQIAAEKGWVSGDGELVLLQGEVTVLRDRGVGVRPVELITTNMRIQRSENFAETDDPVQIRSENSWIDATGMRVWFGDSVRIKLLNEVRGQYEVN